MAAASPIVAELAQLPVFVRLPQVASIYGLHPKTLQRKCAEGSFYPPPALKYPYRWRRDDLVRDITGRATKRALPKRAHGFAAVKARQTG